MWVTNLGVRRAEFGPVGAAIPVAPDLVAKTSRRTDMSANISDFFCSSSRATSLSLVAVSRSPATRSNSPLNCSISVSAPDRASPCFAASIARLQRSM